MMTFYMVIAHQPNGQAAARQFRWIEGRNTLLLA
jgi:hypothetical protein